MRLTSTIIFLSIFSVNASAAKLKMGCFELQGNGNVPSYAGPVRVIKDIVTAAPLRNRKSAEDWMMEIVHREIEREFFQGRNMGEVKPIIAFRKVSRKFYWDNMEVVRYRREHYAIPLF